MAINEIARLNAKLNNAQAEIDKLQRELRWARAWSLFWYEAAVSAESSVALAFKEDYY